MEEASRKFIKQALQDNYGNVAAAARQIGLSRQTLHEYMKRHSVTAQRSSKKGNRGNEAWRALA
jgi:transcriptional regulator of acetoin/glycerol metabolism